MSTKQQIFRLNEPNISNTDIKQKSKKCKNFRTYETLKILGHRNSLNGDPDDDENVAVICGNQPNPNEPLGNIYLLQIL